MEKRRFFTALPALLSLLAGVMFCLLLGLLVFGQPVLQAYYGNLSLLSNAVLWPAALILIALMFLARARLERESAASPTRGRWPLRAFFLLLFVVQLIIARCTWYKMGWDVATVYTSAEELARGAALSDPAYFQGCPNNAPLTLLQAVPLWIAVKAGLAVPFVVLPYIDALLLNLTAYMCVLCAQQMTRSRFARAFALVLSVGWIALSPYIMFPYSDTFSILFPVLALYIYLACRRPLLKWFLIALTCFFGASIKPTVLIVLIALLLLGGCRFLARRDFHRSSWKRPAAIAAALILGALPGRLWQSAATAYLTGSSSPEMQLSETHYLMLGMNSETYGGHSPDDVAFSQSFPTLSERRSANLETAWQRFCEKGFMGNLRFFAIKAYKAYADGSFAAHSSFLDLEIPKRTDALSVFLRSLYHHRGTYSRYCQTLVQMVWLGVLTLCAYTAFRRRKEPVIALLSLTLIGLTAYLLLFEVWPRYLFLYAPFFVLLSCMAFDKPIKALQKR